eukprot:UC4_evm1s889
MRRLQDEAEEGEKRRQKEIDIQIATLLTQKTNKYVNSEKAKQAQILMQQALQAINEIEEEKAESFSHSQQSATSLFLASASALDGGSTLDENRYVEVENLKMDFGQLNQASNVDHYDSPEQ